MQQEKTVKGFELRITASNSNVTGSCNHLELLIPNGKPEEVLVDCGAFLESDTVKYNGTFLFNPKKIQAVFLTHYHVDHYGQIPILYEQGFTGKVYSSEHTIQSLKEKAMSNFFAERRARSNTDLVYGENAALNMLKNAEGIEYDREYQITKHIKIKIFPNQHSRGASMFLVICEYREHRIYALFTGDYKASKFPSGLEMYKDVPISIITEGTYGDKEKPEPKFLDRLNHAVRDGEELVVIATGDGRYESVLEKIEEARTQELIPKETVVYVEERKKLTDELNLREDNPYVYYVSKTTEKQDAIYDKSPKVIIVTTRGGVNFFMEEMTSKERAVILLTNYISDGSRARNWVDTPRYKDITIGKEKFVKRAKILEIRDFCGHAFAEDIAKFLNNFTNIVALFIGHGEKDSKRSLVPVLAKKINLSRDKIFVLRRDIGYTITTNSAKYYK